MVLDELGEASGRPTQELLDSPRDLGRGTTCSLIRGEGERALDHPGRAPRADEPFPSFLRRFSNILHGSADRLSNDPGDVSVAQRLWAREDVLLTLMARCREGDRCDRGDIPGVDEGNSSFAGRGTDPPSRAIVGAASRKFCMKT